VYNPSCAGLTRASIHLQEMMDCRVKPGNDSTADNSLNPRYKLFRLVSV
jgi:hypothetical protein